MSALSERINSAIAEKACSAADLAKAAGVKEASVSNWRSQETMSLKAEPALKAAAYLGVSPYWLVFGVGPRRPSDIDRHMTELAVMQQTEEYRKTNVLSLPGSALSEDERTVLEAFRRADKKMKTYLLDSASALLQRLDGFSLGTETLPSHGAKETG